MFNNYEYYQDACEEATLLNKTAVFDALSAAGITAVTVDFDGYGDSGQIQGITPFAGDASVELPKMSVAMRQISHAFGGGSTEAAETSEEQSLFEAIEALCYDWLEERHGGWEIDDGSFGEFEFNVPARTIRLEYNGRITDVVTEHEEF
jgi:hypothetical protein